MAVLIAHLLDDSRLRLNNGDILKAQIFNLFSGKVTQDILHGVVDVKRTIGADKIRRKEQPLVVLFKCCPKQGVQGNVPTFEFTDQSPPRVIRQGYQRSCNHHKTPFVGSSSASTKSFASLGVVAIS